jgi:hypothetical protein
VLQDLAKIGIVRPGKLKFASRYADPDLSHVGRAATFHVRNRRDPYSRPEALTLEFSSQTVNATAVVCSVSLHQGTLFTADSATRQFVSLDRAHEYCLSSPFEEPKANSHPTRSAILEMRPAHTPLEEMASEEMSEFDRDYPW